MARSLSFLPQEALAIITSHLSGHEALTLLVLCGSSALSAKLYAGGLDTLHLTLSELPWSLCKSLPKLRLRSFSIESRQCNLIRLKYLIHHLPPTLLRLSIDHADVMQILLSEDFDLESLLPLVSCLHLPWNIGQCFPNLDTLHISGMRKAALADLGTNFQLKFILSLPKSLTDLRIRGLGKRCSVDLWPLLPPHLTSLSHMLGLPSARLPASLQSSFRSLNVRTAPIMPLNPFPWSLITAPAQLIIPNSLTSLVLQTENLASLDNFPAFPDTLTDLNWVTVNTIVFHPADILQLMPPGLKSMVISGFEIQRLRPPRIPRQAPDAQPALVLPSVTKAVFNFEMAVRSSTANPIRSYMLNSVPNAKFLHFLHKGSSATLSRQDLGIFGKDLHTLRVALDLEFLRIPTLLAFAFGHLQSLTLLNKVCPAFNFEVIPPTVTYLHVGRIGDLTTETLQLIPPSVTQLRANSMTLIMLLSLAPSFDDLQGAPQPLVDGAYVQTNMTVSTTMTYVPNRNEIRDGGRREPSFFLVPATPATDPDYCIELTNPTLWPQFEFPPTLTSLSLAHHVSNLVWFLGPAKLPHLETLSLNYQFHADYEPDSSLAQLTGLRSLNLLRLDGSEKVTVPPNLTRLTVNESLILPPSFLPLPLSLTELSCNGCLKPFASVAPLKHLRIFKAKADEGPRTDGIIDLLPSAPLEQLSIDVSERYAEIFPLLVSRFKSLRQLSINCISFDSELLTCFHSAIPEHISIGVDNWQKTTELGALAKRAGFAHGTIGIAPGDSFHEFMRLATSQAFPRIGKVGTYPLPHSFTSLVPFLSPSTKELDLVTFGVTIHSFDEAQLPEGLEKLTANLTSSFLQFDVSALPRNLLSLDLPILPDFKATFEALPRSLTHLSLRQQLYFSAASASVLPPGLRHLMLPLYDASNEVLAALPQSIQLLDIGNRPADFDIASLPSSLKLLRDTSKDVPWDLNDTNSFAYCVTASKAELILQSTYIGNPRLDSLYNDAYLLEANTN